MKYIFTLILTAGFITLSFGQTIRMKSSYSETSSVKTYNFETASFEGKLSATNAELKLVLKNTTSTSISLDPANITLLDITGRGVHCKGSVTTFAPGEKRSLNLEPSSTNTKKGFFELRKKYDSKSLFKEEAQFLRNKKWRLSLGGEEVVIYTDL